MSDIKLFQVTEEKAQEMQVSSVTLEKSLQSIFEANLEALLGVRFVASEYSTGSKHRGRIDTLGIDENNCPVIIEYKRSKNENVINQGLFYLDWLMDHRSEFELRVLEKYGENARASIEWAVPRLICIAEEFTRYDEHAVYQINRNIELMRYKFYDKQYLILELANQPTISDIKHVDEAAPSQSGTAKPKSTAAYKTALEALESSNESTQKIFKALQETLITFGEDVRIKPLKFYIAFTRIRNFVTLWPNKDKLLVWVKIDPDSIVLEEGFTKNMKNIGHWGTGDLEISINSMEALAKAEPLLLRAYQEA